MEKKLKIILAVVATILVALVAFVGVYTKDGVVFKSKLPDYELSLDFKDKRITSFIPSEEENEVIYDKDGNKVDSIPEDANEEDYRRENEKVNKEESLTTENFEKIRETFIGRLDTLKVNYYEVRLDRETGKIAVELEDNLATDTLLQDLLYNGDFSITDSESGDILIDKANVKSAQVAYRNTQSGITVYLDIKFDKDGASKLHEISKEYLKPEVEGEETPEKQVAIVMEDTKLFTTNFAQEITTGELTLSIGTSTNNETIQGYVEQTELYAMLINNPTLPIHYDIDVERTVEGNLVGNTLGIIIWSVVIIVGVIMLYFICRFKQDGLIAAISMIMSAGLLLLALRYTNTEITLNTFVAFVALAIIDAYLINKILSSVKNNTSYDNVAKSTLRVYVDEIGVVLASIIIAVIFTFMTAVQAYSLGMALFYGIISVGISNLLILRPMLLAVFRK